MATIRERLTRTGQARYFVEIRRRGCRPLRATFSTRTKAKAWARKVEGDLETRRFLPHVEASRHTLAEAIERYLEDHVEALSNRTARLRKRELVWWKSRLGRLLLVGVSPAAIAGELRELRRRVSGATCNRRLAALSAVLERARRDWEWIETNPARRVRRYQESQGRVRFLSDSERTCLLAACAESSDRRLLPLVLFAMTTGAREGELLNLRWKDVDLSDPPRAVLHETKNRDRRQLTFAGAAGELLRTLARAPHISGYVLVGSRGGRGFPQEAWTEAKRSAGIEDFRFHDLRHTAASYAAQSGTTTLIELANFLGHRSLRMVQRYAHLTEQESAAVSERVARRIEDH